MDKTKEALLDEISTAPAFCRGTALGDSPPAKAPVDGYLWNKHEEFWQESDEMLRTRIKAGMAKPFPIRPIRGRVIIKIETSGEKVSESGIIVSLDSDREAESQEGLDRVGVVVAFDEEFYDSPRNASYQEAGNEDGPGAFVQKQNKPSIELGDRIFFQTSWVGEGFKFEGEQYHCLEGEDAAAFIPDGVVIEAAKR
jgi:co-chaperonin GroES (HSP10)